MKAKEVHALVGYARFEGDHELEGDRRVCLRGKESFKVL
jgi:hypothetical protein